MTHALKPLPGFDWSLVEWGRPDSPRSAVCSYCFAGISDDDDFVPLISTEQGYVAQFCDKCMRKWWGFE